MAVTAFHHITVRVQNPEATRDFFTSLGFASTDIPVPSEMARTWRGSPASGVLIAIPVGSTYLVIAPPLDGAPPNDRFDEHRTGVDHLAFAVESVANLEQLLSRLQELKIPTAGIEKDEVLGHMYVCFRDSDNIQWEFYAG